MTLPQRNLLPVNCDYDTPHINEFIKCDFRDKDEADAYFTALGNAGTLSFYGNQGEDYEFDPINGYRDLTVNGGCRIKLSDILTGDTLKYLFYGGLTLFFELVTDEWIEPAPPPVYDNPVEDMDGVDASTSGDHNTYLMTFWQNNSQNCGALRCYDDTTTYETKGRNKLMFLPTGNLSNPSVCSRPLSRYNKGQHLEVKVTFHDGVGNMWIDDMTAVPPHGGATPTSTGERRTHRNNANQVQYNHTTGEMYLFIGRYNDGSGAGCKRWIRNIRLVSGAIDYSFHPMLARVISFGDSFSASIFGPAPLSPTHCSLGDPGSPGQYIVDDYTGFADINATLRFHQLLTKAGYQIGGMYGAGQGGHWLSAGGAFSLLDLGYTDTFIQKYFPTLVFTFGLHNDAARIRDGALTIESLQTQLINNYLIPVFERGCYGWGFIIPGMPEGIASTQAGIDAWDSVASMLLGLPAVIDATYPEHAGKVKVYDARAEMGNGSTTNRNFRTYFRESEKTHPSQYGNQFFGEKCAKMAIELIRQG